MLPFILLDLKLFRDGTRELNAKGLLGFLEALTHWNEIYLDEHANTLPLYQSGVRYAIPEPFQRQMPSSEKVIKALRKAGIPRQMAEQVADTITRGEHFRDIPTLYENHAGDCFPHDTRVFRKADGLVRFGQVQRGDVIWGRGRWTEVRAVVSKGILPVDRVRLVDHFSFDLTRDHKVFVVNRDRSVRRIPVGALEPGMEMIRPHARPLVNLKGDGFGLPLLSSEFDFYPLDERVGECGSEHRVLVASVERNAAVSSCVDVETADHTVYLPDAHVVVSQCDNLACARAAELRSVGFDASSYITHRRRLDGGFTYHAIVRWPDGTGEDPSLLLGMGGPSRNLDRAEENRRLGERREHAAFALAKAREEGRPVDLVRARRIAEILAPVPASPEEVSGWEREASQELFRRV